MTGDLEFWAFVTGIAGTLFGVYAYFKQRTIKSASFWYRNSILLGGRGSILPQEVTILFGERKITNLKKINVIFWNSGNTTIDENDLVPVDPLRVVLDGEADILKPSVVYQSTSANGAKIYEYEPDKREIYVGFAYLDPRQGWNLEILYEGKSASVVVHGTIKGIPQGFSNVVKIEESFFIKFLESGLIFPVYGLTLTAIAGTISIFDWIEVVASYLGVAPIDVFLLVLGGVILIAVATYALRWLLIPRMRPPDDLVV